MTASLLLATLLASPDPSAGAAPSPLPFDLANRMSLVTVHATGAQVYECRRTAEQIPTWIFREPIATLIKDGKTVGRHYAGPSWALDDGSTVIGKQIESAPGQSAADIPQLKLDVVGHAGHGQLDRVTHIYRIDTQGGMLAGACEVPGTLRAVPYNASYIFTD